MEAQGELMVHLIVAPGAGVTVNWLVWIVPGQVMELRVEMQSVTLIASVSEQELTQPLVSVTARPKTAVPGPLVRVTVVDKFVQPLPQELGPTIWAGPDTTLQVSDVIGLSPAWAEPFNVKVFVAPWLQTD